MTKRSKYTLITIGLIVVVFGYYVLAFGRLAINATSSMPANAYAMVTWPKSLKRGRVVAAELPEALQEIFEGKDLYLTKRIVGIAGDPIHRNGDQICVFETCVNGQRKDGVLVAPLLKADRVPTGTIVLFGESDDSLDSRYDIIGAIPIENVVAAGFAIPFPHWSKVREWLQ